MFDMTLKQELMRQTVMLIAGDYNPSKTDDMLESATKIVDAILSSDDDVLSSDNDSDVCTAPKDPDHVLTGDEIKRLAETGSLCDCADFTQYGGDCPIEEGDQFDFGTAIHLMKLGNRVQRAGWNGKSMFLYYVPAASYPMQRNSLKTMGGIFPDDMVPYGAYIAMKTAQDNVVPWLASQTDVLAEDWQLA